MAFTAGKILLRGWGWRSTPEAVEPQPHAPAAAHEAAAPRPRSRPRKRPEASADASVAAVTSTTAEPASKPARSRARARPTTQRRVATAAMLLDPDVKAARESRPIRIVLVEEIDDVVSHAREMLRGQGSIRLVGVVRDGRKAVDEIRELRPDVVIVDTLLQGRVKGPAVLRRIREARLPVGVVALTVPNTPVDLSAADGFDTTVTLPFGTYDLVRGIGGAMDALAGRDPTRGHRTIAVFGAKGGVGKTTIAYNLAAAIAASGVRTALVDGSLQYADVRHLVRAAPDQPSICDLPTDCVRASDLATTVLADPSGVDVLLGPPRPEMAELVTPRDIEATVDLLRRGYQATVVDLPSALNETTLALLDAADLILQIVTPETGALDATRTGLETFAALGYPSSKVQIVINRVDTRGGLTRSQITRALGREPAAELPSDWPLVSGCNAEGVPFVLGRPDSPLSQAVTALAAAVSVVVGTPPQARRTRARRTRTS